MRALCVAACLWSCGSDEEDEAVPLPPVDRDSPAPWDPDATYQPVVQADDLSTAITNPLFPAPVGARWLYEGKTEEGLERTEVQVLDETRDVWGVTATVVRDTVKLDGVLIEDTWDWYAQDADGHVWYLGEDSHEYEDGEEVCTCGSWQSGKEGALPGVIMLAAPKVGDAYRQEYLAGTAEDIAEVVETGVSVKVKAGSFENCVKTRDLNLLERDVEEFKYVCPGVGLVLEEEEEDRVELISYSGL